MENNPASDKKLTVIFLILIGLLWIFLFRHFLAGHYQLLSDSVVYYEHFKFFSDQMRSGDFPIWDPFRTSGVPNEFFLRRMGAYNPFYFLLLIFYLFRVPFDALYFSFLAFYFLLGVVGFYKLAREMLGESALAWLAAALLLFSTIGALLFTSFILLLFVPLAWFFYFGLSFVKQPRSFAVLGMTFCSMLLLSTYIPFYFITIVTYFLLCAFVVDPKYFSAKLKTSFGFMLRRKALVGFCILSLGLASLPAYLFYQDSQTGDFVLPVRQLESLEDNPFAVPPQVIAENGGIDTHDLLRNLSYDLRQIHPGIVYIPYFAFILFALCLWVDLNKRLMLLVLFGFGIYLVSLYDATFVYNFLYDHIFFFKYFRNFQFFLWLVLLPVFILVCCEHLKQFHKREASKARLWAIIAIHLAVFAFLLSQHKTLVSSYLVVLLSLAYFLLSHWGRLAEPLYRWGLLFLVVCIQPWEVYGYFHKNMVPFQLDYNYQNPNYNLNLPTQDDIQQSRETFKQQLTMDPYKKAPPLYYGVKNIYELRQKLHPAALDYYLVSRFKIYDRVQIVGAEGFHFEAFQKVIMDDANVAFVSPADPTFERTEPLSQGFVTDQPVENIAKESPDFKIRKFGVNVLSVETRFSQPKFLVYNDNYYKGWRAFIDGEEVPLYKANYAFKGLWVPAGTHMIVFQFGAGWRKLLDGSLFILFAGCLAGLIYFWRKEDHQRAGGNI